MGILYLIVAGFLMYLNIKLCVDMTDNISNGEFKLFFLELIALIFTSTYTLINGIFCSAYLCCKPSDKQNEE